MLTALYYSDQLDNLENNRLIITVVRFRPLCASYKFINILLTRFLNPQLGKPDPSLRILLWQSNRNGIAILRNII